MLEIGSMLDGKYKILSEIGHGGMSVVYMARNEKANKTWAVKEVRKDGKMDFNMVKQGLVAEIETLKKLHHPNLPSIIDVIEDDEVFIIVMDYIEGNSLDKALEEYGAQPQEYVIEWAKQLCDVLGYLHTRNPAIIYRDMKPANIMLKPDGNVMVVDFGTAKTVEIDLGETTGIGTIGYAAPEQYIGSGLGRTDARTDIYCLGITLYHLLTGVDPCKNVINDKSIRSVNPSLSSGIDHIILKCTDPEPNNRYQSCAELMYALEHYEETDDIYRKKQWKKLISFSASVLLTLVFAISSAVFYVSAESKKTENYDVQLVEASNPEKTDQERTSMYMKAIAINTNDERAYTELIKFFLSNKSDGENGDFGTDEAAAITQLKAGIDIKNASGYSSTTYPLEELKNNNPKGYTKVCYDIGTAYWYDYSVKSERYSSATEWLLEAVGDFPVAKIYCDIGECQQQIKKYEGQNRTEKMYEAYSALWAKMIELNSEATKSEDNDTKILVWSEIADTISEKASYFIVNTPASDINALLELISKEASELKSSTKYNDVKDLTDKVILAVTNTKARVEAANNK